MGFALDADANQHNRDMIHAEGSRPVLRITANEEAVIRERVESVLEVAP